MLSDITLFAHATFGALGALAAVWVFVETLNTRSANIGRIRAASLATAVLISLAWICGGYWYLRFYPADRFLILKGPWPFAHSLFMETKEHLFFVTAILALLLPIVAREPLDSNPSTRRLVLSIAALVAVTAFALEGAGAVIAHSVKLALLRHQP